MYIRVIFYEKYFQFIAIISNKYFESCKVYFLSLPIEKPYEPKHLPDQNQYNKTEKKKIGKI
jgi:hypothetical protein